MKDITVRLDVQAKGYAPLTFKVKEEPHSENDLLGYVEYRQFYFSIGLGAPIKATVTVKEGFFKQHKYTFTYEIKGNSVTADWFDDKLCEVVARRNFKRHLVKDNTHVFLYTPDDYQTSYEDYTLFEGICNIEAHQDKRKGGDYIVYLEFHPVLGADNAAADELKAVSSEEIFNSMVTALSNRGRKMNITEEARELFELESTICDFNYKCVIDYYKSNGELNTMEDYGKASSLTALNCFCAGIYTAKINAQEDVPSNWYVTMLDKYGVYGFSQAVMEAMDIEVNSDEGQALQDDMVAVMKIGASYNNKIESKEQTREVWYALIRAGIVFGDNLINNAQ